PAAAPRFALRLRARDVVRPRWVACRQLPLLAAALYTRVGRAVRRRSHRVRWGNGRGFETTDWSTTMSRSRRISHYPRCFGCGNANDRGLRLDAQWDGEELVARHTAPIDAEGGPGVVHGGYVAALVDETMALAASAFANSPAMTRRIEID